MRLHCRNYISIFRWLSIEDSFWNRDGGLCPLLLSAQDIIWRRPCAGLVHAASVSGSFIWALIMLICWPPAPLVLALFLNSGISELWGEGIDGDIPFKAEWPTLCRVIVFVPICCRREFLWWRLNKTLIYELAKRHHESLRVNMSLYGIFFFTNSIRFILGPGLSSLRLLVTQAVLVWVPSHGVGLKSKQILVGCSHNVRANIALAYLTSRTQL